jgi:hypothetical protein
MNPSTKIVVLNNKMIRRRPLLIIVCHLMGGKRNQMLLRVKRIKRKVKMRDKNMDNKIKMKQMMMIIITTRKENMMKRIQVTTIIKISIGTKEITEGTAMKMSLIRNDL